MDVNRVFSECSVNESAAKYMLTVLSRCNALPQDSVPICCALCATYPTAQSGEMSEIVSQLLKGHAPPRDQQFRGTLKEDLTCWHLVVYDPTRLYVLEMVCAPGLYGTDYVGQVQRVDQDVAERLFLCSIDKLRIRRPTSAFSP